jgi:RNA polymerase sigma-70 factor (ECF subfamily)
MSKDDQTRARAEALMLAYAQGDARAFEALFDLLAPRLRAFFLRMFRESATADDLLQVTFLKMHRARTGFAPGRGVRPWAYAIAGRVGLDELRKRKRTLEDASDDVIERTAQAEPGSAEDAASAAERARRVREAIDRLPDGQRVVVHLHRFEELTFAEIARTLSTTEGAVKLRAFRAYENLRKLLAPLIEKERAA